MKISDLIPQLRRGNLLLGIEVMSSKEEVFKVVDIYENYINPIIIEGCFEGSVEKAEPIPLTEAWLLKFGFTYQDESKLLSIQIGNNMLIEFDMSLPDMDMSVMPTSWSGGCLSPWHQCKHVHQLQNIYFALTGEELQLKN